MNPETAALLKIEASDLHALAGRVSPGASAEIRAIADRIWGYAREAEPVLFKVA